MVSQTKMTPIKWDSAANMHLEGVGGLAAMDYYKMWHAKKVNVFAVTQGPGRVATVVLRFDRRLSDSVLMCAVVAFGGSGDQLAANILPEIERMARLAEATEVFFDTDRMGLIFTAARALTGRKLRLSWSL